MPDRFDFNQTVSRYGAISLARLATLRIGDKGPVAAIPYNPWGVR
jgi:hypothetical protein